MVVRGAASHFAAAPSHMPEDGTRSHRSMHEDAQPSHMMCSSSAHGEAIGVFTDTHVQPHQRVQAVAVVVGWNDLALKVLFR